LRDTTSLSAAPGLWSSIKVASSASDWLLLMGSPMLSGGTTSTAAPLGLAVIFSRRGLVPAVWLRGGVS
jgi:hypothetical protein